MKNVMVIIIFFGVSISMFAQIQKIFSSAPDKEFYFGTYNMIWGKDVFIMGFEGERPHEFPRYTLFQMRGKNKWKSINSFEYSVTDTWISQYFNNKLIRSKDVNIDDTLDLLLIYNINQEGELVVEDTIFIPYLGIQSMKIYKDWIIFTQYPIGVFPRQEYFYFFHYEDKKWVKKKLFKYTIDAFNGGFNYQSIQINDTFTIISNNSDFTNGPYNGKVVVFKLENKVHWKEVQQILQPDPYYTNSGFGTNLSLDPENKFMVISADRDRTGRENNYFNQCLYIYKNINGLWELFQKLNGRDISENGYLGSGLISSDELLISNAGKYPTGNFQFNKGAIYQYKLKNGSWTMYREISPPYLDTTYYGFGVSTSRFGETVVTGAVSDTTLFYKKNGNWVMQSGAAYIFQIPARDTLTAGICEGESYTFNDTVIYDTGRYTDTLLASYGVDSVVQLYLTVYPREQIEIDTILCDDESLMVGDSLLTEEGIYTIYLKNIHGCDSIVTARIEYDYLEVSDIITADYGCQNGEINLVLQGNNPPYAFNWNTGDSGEDISELSKGEYNVTITSANGCEYDYEYQVEDSIAYLIPNAFFPSGQEEINSIFKPYTAKDVHIFSTQIYNRWGEKVFSGAEDEYWDGTYQGNAMSPGVYLYRMEIDSPCGQEVKTGQVVLMR